MAVRRQVHDAKVSLPQGGVQPRGGERRVPQDRAAVEVLKGGELLGHVRQGGAALDGARQAGSEHLDLVLRQGPWLGKRQARGDGHGVFFDEEPLAVVQGRQGEQS